MTKFVVRGALLATTFIAGPALAQPAASPFNGAYVGAHVGVGQVEDLATDRDDYWTNARNGVTTDDGLQAGIQVGYDHAFGPALLGVMGEATFGKLDSFQEISSGGDGINDIYKVGTRVSTLGSVRAKAGLTDGALAVFGTVGLAASNAKQRFLETYYTDGAFYSAKGDRTGIVYGMGMDYAVGNRMTVGLAYSLYDFGKRTHDLENSGNPAYRFIESYKVRQIAATVGYHFGGAGVVPAGNASAFAGPYVGVQIGRSTLTSVSNDLDYYFYNAQIQTRDSGVIFGAQAGYDLAFGPLLVGALGEMSFGKVNSFGDTSGDPTDYYYSAGTRISRLGSVRGKLGLASGRLSGFVTGGYAFSNATQTLDNGWDSNGGYHEKGDRSGTVVGLGGAYALTGHARIGVDYSQYSFGKRQHLLGDNTDYRMTDEYKVRTLKLTASMGF